MWTRYNRANKHILNYCNSKLLTWKLRKRGKIYDNYTCHVNFRFRKRTFTANRGWTILRLEPDIDAVP